MIDAEYVEEHARMVYFRILGWVQQCNLKNAHCPHVLLSLDLVGALNYLTFRLCQGLSMVPRKMRKLFECWSNLNSDCAVLHSFM